MSNGAPFPGTESRRCPQRGSRVAASSLPPAAVMAWGNAAAGLTLPEEAASSSSSPEAAAFLRWAISSLLHPGNANSRAAWKEVMLPERFRTT